MTEVVTWYCPRVQGADWDCWDRPTLSVNGKCWINATLLADLLISIKTPGCRVVDERVSARLGRGVKRMFTFGLGFGILKGVIGSRPTPVLCTAAGIAPSDEGPPGKDGSQQCILELKPSCSPLFSRKRDHGRADAALIASHGKTQCSYTDTNK